MGQRYLLVDGDAAGLSAWQYDPMGLRGASNGGLKLEQVRVPKENAVGEEPGAMMKAIRAKGNSVMGPHLIAQGCAGVAIQEAIRYVRRTDRREWMVHALSPLSDRLNALRSYVYYTARMKERGYSPDLNHAHNEIQRLGGEVGPAVCDGVLELLGGGALMRGSRIQRSYRDARASCYPAFSMPDRRLNSVDGLLGRDLELERDEPETMRWDPAASFAFWLLWARGGVLMSEAAQQRLARPRFEEFARSQGSDELSMELYLQHLMASTERPSDGLKPAGAGR